MPRGPRFLAVAHLKGGSGATSVAVNVAAGLALKRRAVALLDCDPIAAATYHLLDGTPARTVADCLEGRATLPEALAATAVPGLRVLAASHALAVQDRRPERFPVDLARVLGQAPRDLDYAILDLPPSAGAITRGTLAVLPGGAVLAPIQARVLDAMAFGELLRLVRELREQNPALHLAGIVPTRVNRTRLAADVVEALTREHGRRVLPGIREAASVARAPLRRRPLQLTAPRSPAAADFAALVRALLRTMEG